ncbi:MAG: hypothetical protein V1816_10030 [Pseudomonadota bacterium]
MRTRSELSVPCILALVLLLASCASMGVEEADDSAVPGISVMMRLVKSSEGVFYDPATKLEWLPGPDQNTTFEAAVQWASGQSTAGGGWRLPTLDELKTLRGLEAGVFGHSVRGNVWFVWSSEKRVFRWSAWGYLPNSGRRAWRGYSYEFDSRAAAVRVKN